MNAPFPKVDMDSKAGALNLFAFFHLNLAYSSIEEEQRGEVIAKCYWPLLHFAEKVDRIIPDQLRDKGYSMTATGN